MNNYSPYIFTDADDICNPDYFTFVDKTVFSAGLEFYYERAVANSGWSYWDTKFNPNLGTDLDPVSYKRIYTWFLGRGLETAVVHLSRLNEFTFISERRRHLIAIYLKMLIDSQSAAIHEIRRRNSGRCPHIVDLHFNAIDEEGSYDEFDSTFVGCSDYFCCKGLIAASTVTGNPEELENLKKIIKAMYEHRFLLDQLPYNSEWKSQAPLMLYMGAVPYLMADGNKSERGHWVEQTIKGFEHIFDNYFSGNPIRFSENLNIKTGETSAAFDPGHGIELAGLGLAAVQAIRSSDYTLFESQNKRLLRVEKILPEIFKWAFRIGFNEKWGGIHKTCDGITGEPLNSDMPWWNLPETLRAAALCLKSAKSEQEKELYRKIMRTASNAYFQNYINTHNGLFPFQTRSGTNGKVIPVAPAVPEGDPLYHSNLALLEMVDQLSGNHKIQ
jgi:mannose/cellobiose epimerase-like protein (N-acyl-D-glucosamine 2-epimerase family)